VLAAKAAPTTTPTAFLVSFDPVAFGLVASLNHPGGNVTGVTLLVRESTKKRLEILREIVPGIATIGFLVNPSNSNSEGEVRDIQDTGHSLGLRGSN
jgi:putative tryptophan/tyrosine transport system substrate-binding protein